MSPQDTNAAPTHQNFLPDPPAYLLVGKLRRPHGVKGEMVMDVYTDFPERLRKGVQVYAGDNYHPLRLRSQRPNGRTLLVAFEGYDTPESAGALRNQNLYVPSADRPPLPDGEYYHHQIIGLQVITEDSRILGKVVEILSSPANDVYVIQPQAGPEILLPALKSVILNVDLAQGKMLVHLLPGILPESE
jgi:16S rRNA processing protein RimM